MRINSVQNSAAFGQLQVRSRDIYYLNESKLKSCEKQLANTKFVDVILDSQGFAIKDKMTDILHRIQSFSLFPQDKAVGIRMIDEEAPAYLLNYSTKEQAKNEWQSLCELTSKISLDLYTKVALWLDEKLVTKN